MTNPIPQSHTTITSVGSVVASILSAGTAFLAWKTKLRFSKEFTEAKKAQVEAARAQTEIAEAKVKAAEAQKNAEIEKIKAEIARKEVEIKNLSLQLEASEKRTPQNILEAYEAMKKLYGTFEQDIQVFIDKANNSKIKKNIELFQDGLEKLEKEIKVSSDNILRRKKAQEVLKKHQKHWIIKAFQAAAEEYPNLKQKNFSLDISDYLELIYHCLIVGNNNILEKSNFNLKFPINSYRIAFEHIKNDIIQNLSKEESDELIPYIDYIVNNILLFY